MQRVLIIGAGRSATSLINYMLEEAKSRSWLITVADYNLDLAVAKIKGSNKGKAIQLDINDEAARQSLIEENDVIISMLPAHMHNTIAEDCLKFSKHMITASYVSDEIRAMHSSFQDKGILFMGEMGLDPGIDHMSAIQKIHEIKALGGKIISFRSYTGGIIAEDSDDNPWHYKFTWNPRNVVLAGQSTAKYLIDNKFTYAPYRRLFKDAPLVDIKQLGQFEMYPNRDSLDYQEVYGLQDTPNLLRGTLRRPGFCQAWDALISIGLTDDSYQIEDSNTLTYHDFVEAYVRNHEGKNIQEKVANFLGLEKGHTIMKQLEWLDIFSDQIIDMKEATPAQILQKLLMQKWTLKPEDKDLIIMQHEFEYTLEGEQHLLFSTMYMEGKNSTDTAMSKLVGLPIGIFTKLILLQKVSLTGVHIPVSKSVYAEVLRELENFGVKFNETQLAPVV